MDPTLYAPADRTDQESINKSFKEVSGNRELVSLLDSLPNIVALLNFNREIVFCNKLLLTKLGKQKFNEVLGQRPGETLNCENAVNKTGGCGTSKSCKYCGAVNAILQSQETKQKTTHDCRITALDNTDTKWFDLAVTASPFIFGGNEYTILTINDVSDQKRRRALEQIFFHDIVNKIGSLNGVFELIREIEEKDKLQNFLDLAFTISQDLSDEILAQKELLAAENGELRLNLSNTSVKFLLKLSAQQIQNHSIVKDKNVIIEETIDDFVIETDTILLKRILTNMLKNALEAVGPNETVCIGYEMVSGGIRIYVKNKSYISEEVQSNLFKRSFSTKGADRGLGTYSMKLLGETYLRGKVGYHTNKETGTAFYITIPLNLKV